MHLRLSACMSALAVVILTLTAPAQDKSVNPDINKKFQNPDVKEFIGKFEVESREIYANRQRIAQECNLKPGMAVADIGAGTGLFTRLFAEAVGPKGKVYAVDIAPSFVRHIENTTHEAGLKNVVGVVCTQTSAKLPPQSVDRVFICDTYHHFEFPHKTMASIRAAMKPGGQLVLIDFHRIEGTTKEWTLKHVRAGQEVFVKEIESSGFRKIEEKEFLKENYFVRFEVEGKR